MIATPGSRRRRTRLGALLIGASLLLTYVAGEVGNESAIAAPLPGLKVLPASGPSTGVPIDVEIPEACPTDAVDYLIPITGGGFPEGSFMIGRTPLEPGQKHFKGPGDWQTIASQSNAQLPLKETATLTLMCITAADAIPKEYTTTVAFTPTTGTAFTFAAAGGVEATPTPSGSASPTPTGSATPTPTGSSSPSPIASPTPDPSEEPTPTPCVTVVREPTPTPVEGAEDDCEVIVDETDASDPSDNSGNLPDTGGQSPSNALILAAMLGILGSALLLFEGASRLPEDEA